MSAGTMTAPAPVAAILERAERAADVPPWAVLNVAVTRLLGLYADETAAREAAREFGGCSFPYQLSDAERAGLAGEAAR